MKLELDLDDMLSQALGLVGSSPGALAITQERFRQILTEGWTPEHDDEHEHGELLEAAHAYLTAADACAYGPRCVTFDGGFRPGEGTPTGWPWEPEAWKPSSDPIRNLEKAGALIAAEIDRLKRKMT